MEYNVKERKTQNAPGEDLDQAPGHVAFIMDGNGRWAGKRNRPRSEGHLAGVISLERIAQACMDRNIPYVSFYAFSTENWKRPAREVQALFRLMRIFFRRRAKKLGHGNARILVSGDWSALPTDCQRAAAEVMEKTAHCDGITINLCINYGGQKEIRRACSLWAARCHRLQQWNEPDETEMQDLLYNGLPPVDLLIRTGGDRRISNFLLYQIAYAELYFSATYWPDFSPNELDSILYEFGNRIRRMGGLHSDNSAGPNPNDSRNLTAKKATDFGASLVPLKGPGR